ncbi:MAG: hypothetical protein AAF086_09930 [Planctomycetota bacterium]
MQSLSETSKQGYYKAPKTVLGFFAIVIGIATTGISILVATISAQAGLHYLIPWILGFGGFLICGTIAGVFIAAWQDPTRLMLGQVSGSEFIQNRKLSLGDSDSSEYQEPVILKSEVLPHDPPKLPAPKSEDGGGA